MAKFKLSESKIMMSLYDIVKYQIMVYCYTNKIQLNDSDFETLTLLATVGETELTEFCLLCTEKRIFKSTQVVRNCVVKLEKLNLITKDGLTKKKKVMINPDMKIINAGNILLVNKFIHFDTQNT